jgi:hypothetical protein
MMLRRYFILVILLAVKCTLYGQSYDIIASRHFGGGKENLNLTDSLGKKQGKWIHYQMFFDSHCSALSAESSDTCFRTKSMGTYLNNRKIDEWKYYDDGGCYIRTIKIERYYEDGSVEEILPDYNTITLFNKDSSFVTSTTITSDQDTLQTICKDSICTTTYKHHLLKEFDLTILEQELFYVQTGTYNREILKLKQ